MAMHSDSAISGATSRGHLAYDTESMQTEFTIIPQVHLAPPPSNLDSRPTTTHRK